MTDLQTLLHAINELPVDEFQMLRQFVEDRNEDLLDIERGEGTPAERFARLEKAFTEIREGLSEDELARLTEAITYENLEP